MQVFNDIGALQQFLTAERHNRQVVLVPTMGALHHGHAACVARAREIANALVVCSIFVNPSQFGPGEDFELYPRTLDSDAAQLRTWKCDVLFAPPVSEMYPEMQTVWVDPGALAEPLCGRFRPGHFRGVATVVTKLFEVVRPDMAIFGQKDAQQALVISSVVRQLNMDVDLCLAQTVREPDGLALSSRNAYLDAVTRRQAGALYGALTAARRALESGERDPRRIEAVAIDFINAAGINRIDYVELRKADDLSTLDVANGHVILAIAAYAGSTRLIDNMVFNVQNDGVESDIMLY